MLRATCLGLVSNGHCAHTRRLRTQSPPDSCPQQGQTGAPGAALPTSFQAPGSHPSLRS